MATTLLTFDVIHEASGEVYGQVEGADIADAAERADGQFDLQCEGLYLRQHDCPFHGRTCTDWASMLEEAVA